MKGKTAPANFRSAYEKMNNQTSDYSDYFNELSEIPAFAVEHLSKPWLVPEDTDWQDWNQSNNIPRVLLKNSVKGTYRNFQELDPDFSTNYPEANQAFLDRISQLRNYGKYPTPREYLENRGYTLEPGYIPTYSIRYNQNTNPIARQISPTRDQGTSPLFPVERKNEGEVNPETFYNTPGTFKNTPVSILNTPSSSDDEEYFQQRPGMSRYLSSP